jgi:cardiolipin synthase
MSTENNDPETARAVAPWDARRVFEVALGVPAGEGNQVEVLRNGDEIFPAMLDAIDSSRSTVDLLTFVYWTGEIAERFARKLAERARAGVRVRVLLDGVGARKIDDEVLATMLDGGCDVQWFRPVSGDVGMGDAAHRTHRKVLVCDGEVAFTGGVGIAEEWAGDARGPGEWRDTHFEVRGPAVDGLRSAFLRNWVETGQVLFESGADQFGPQDPVGDTAVQVLWDEDQSGCSTTALCFLLMLRGAERRVRITTAYFTPDDSMLEEICATSARGVQVEVLMPGENSDKSLVQWASADIFQQLLDAGVELHTYDPTMLHAKVMTADGKVAVVGSSNVNSRSLSHDDEVLMALFDEQLVALLDEHFDEDLVRSSPVDPDEWARRGLIQRAKEAIGSALDDLL